MMDQNNTWLIVGAGCFGLSAAYALRKRGHAVTVFDRSLLPAPDAATTDINKAVRPDYGDEVLYQKLGLAAIAKFKEWNELALAKTGRQLFHQCGVAFLAPDREMTEFEHVSLRNLKAAGVNDGDFVHLSPGVASARWPGLETISQHLPFGYVNTIAGFGDSGATATFLKELAQEAGVRFVTGSPHGAFESLVLSDDPRDRADGAVVGMKTADGTVHLGQVLLAAGSWTPTLCPDVAKVCSATAQTVIQFQLKEGDPMLQRYHPKNFPVWFANHTQSGFYGFPATRDGIIKVANHSPGYRSTFHLDELNGKSVKVTPNEIPLEALLQYRQFLERHFPDLNELDIARTRVCWYCDTFDSNFLISQVAERKGLYVATGGSGHAFKFMPVLGDVIADILEGKPCDYRDLFKWRLPKGELSLDASRANGIDSVAAARNRSFIHELPMGKDKEDLSAFAFKSGRLADKMRKLSSKL